MRTSQFLIATLRETPTDAEVISHQLMLRAGLIRKLAAGLYTWLPLGVRVLRKIERVIREEMDKSGAQEVVMPVVQPAELWNESGRWEQYGAELLRIEDRHQRAFCLGPTHEEIITDLIRHEIHSYKQLPANFYQIQTKFRDEIRPRFGVMRAREFTMKDAYSFHLGKESLQTTYEVMYDTYHAIFTRLGLEFRAVLADTGSIGGSASHEFHVLADSGEDDIAFSSISQYAANIELAEAVAVAPTENNSLPETLERIETGDAHSIADITQQLNVSAQSCIKTLAVHGEDRDGKSCLIALILRGDHELNEIKAEKLAGVSSPLQFANDKEIEQVFGAKTGCIGPVKLNIPIIVDRSAAKLTQFVCGANIDDHHFTGAQWERDVSQYSIADIRNVQAGDPSPDGQGTLEIKRGIEVGHIFQLGDKYSSAMKATVLNEQGKAETMQMGCYGIGVTRVMAAAIEQHHDNKGITWPDSIAPFQLALIPLNLHKSDAVRMTTETIYNELKKYGIDILLDDRNERPGVKFSDMELIGIPHQLVIGDKGLERNMVEYRARRSGEQRDIPVEEATQEIKRILTGN